MRKLGVLLLLFVVAGCSTYSLEELRHTESKGNAFQTMLAKQYMDFAGEMERGYDWQNSWHFADKGLLAAYGQEIGPEELDQWDIPAEAKPELEQARSDLLAALTSEAMEKHPEAAAKAQFNFDCWVKHQDQNWQPDAIAQCKEGFAEAMAELKESQKLAVDGVETTAYIVYFEWGQAQLTDAAATIVDGVAAQLAEADTAYEVVLNGHTDTSGSQKYNMRLSLARAESVKKRLVQQGVKADTIQLFAYGETDPAVKTGDKKKEPANRRVEIFLQ